MLSTPTSHNSSQLTMDNRTLAVEKGETILKTARRNGIEIRTLCHMDCLEPTGACRICLVELLDQDQLVAACSYPSTSGLEILTDTEGVYQARKTTIELLLSDNQSNCISCDRRASQFGL